MSHVVNGQLCYITKVSKVVKGTVTGKDVDKEDEGHMKKRKESEDTHTDTDRQGEEGMRINDEQWFELHMPVAINAEKTRLGLI